MPHYYDTENQSDHNSISFEIDILKNKLKLGKNLIELLIKSKGSIKNKQFFDSVSEVMMIDEKQI